jgi:hypothetical protein
MAIANFIKKRFLNKEICISISNGETETVLFNECWVQNREYFQGVVSEVEEGTIVLNILNVGKIYINAEEISYFWTPGVDTHKALKTILTGRLSKTLKNAGIK